jgi:hypothetical protein
MSNQQPQVQITDKANRITQKQIDSAAQGHYYIRTGENRTSSLLLSGAQRRWENHPQDVYVPSMRLAGSIQSISQALSNAGFPNDQIQGVVNSAYNAQNYNSSKANEFNAELQALVDYQKQKKLTTNKAPGVKLSDLRLLPGFGQGRTARTRITLSGQQQQAPKTARAVPRITNTGIGSGTVRSRGGDIRTRLQDVQRLQTTPGNQPKVLDISKYDKIHTVDRPRTIRGRFPVGQLPMISSSRESVVRALNDLGIQPDYINYWDAAAQGRTSGMQLQAPQQQFQQFQQQPVYQPQFQQVYQPQQPVYQPQFQPQQMYQQPIQQFQQQPTYQPQQDLRFPIINNMSIVKSPPRAIQIKPQALNGIRAFGQQFQQPIQQFQQQPRQVIQLQQPRQQQPQLRTVQQMQPMQLPTMQPTQFQQVQQPQFQQVQQPQVQGLPILSRVTGGQPQQLQMSQIPTVSGFPQ